MTTHLYRALLFVALLTNVVVAFETWRQHRGLPVHRALFWGCASLSVWVVGTLVELNSQTPVFQRIGLVVTYAGVLSAPPLWYLICRTLATGKAAGEPGWLSAWTRTTLIVLPAVAWVMLLTSPWHHLYIAGGSSPYWEYGPYWWGHTFFNFTLAVLGTMYLIRFWRLKPLASDRWRLGFLAVAVALSLAGCLAWVFEFTPPEYNPSAPSFALVALAIGLIVLRGDVLDVVPLSAFAIFERLGDGVVIVDAEDRVIGANGAAQRFLHADEASLVGRDFSAAARRCFGDVPAGVDFQTGRSCRIELPQARGSKAVAIQKVLLDARRNATVRAAVHIRDITVEYLVEQDLRRSEARYRLLYTDAADSIFTLDTQGRVVAANPATERLGGYSATDWQHFPSFLDVILPEYREAVREAYERLLRGELVTNFEYSMRTKTGEPLHLSANLRPVLQDGQVVRIEGIARNITERRRAQEQEQQLQAQLAQAQKLGALGRMLAGVAHELNNPLNGVLGYAELLTTDFSLDDEQRRMASRILGAAEQCQGIVADLLRFARNRPVELAPVQVTACIDQVLGMARAELTRAEMTVHVDIPAEYWVRADRSQLQQCLLNLVINARDAMADAPPPRALRIGATADADMVHVQVEDTGPGVPPQVAEKMFDPFFTTKDVGHGTGLGLSLCHSVAAALGGAIVHDDSYTAGARFVLSMPRSAAGTEPRTAPARQRAHTPPPGTRVLLVDDDEDVSDFCALSLRTAGFDVTTAANGIEALEALDRHLIDVVVSDIRMPGMDGRELYDRIQQRPVRPPIVFITGDAVRPETSTFLERSGALCLTKPFRSADLLDLVREALGRRSPAAADPATA